ncbi:MAG TPA: polyphenol oxidase family protein [Longimicrobiales bacterium]
MESSVAAVRIVREVELPIDVPAFGHPEWGARFPWLAQGTTARGTAAEAFDLRLFGAQPVGTVVARWRALRAATGFVRAVHAHQVHGTRILMHDAGPAGLVVADDADGHATRVAGTLLTVSVADCVPVFLVSPEPRAVAVVHAGWRGVAGGAVEAGIAALSRLSGAPPAKFHAHFGPAICGACYEVGPEVHEALGLPRPDRNAPVDLRAVAARRAGAAGVDPAHITISTHCTRCGESPFFSHRAGCVERQVGFLGIRA